MDKTNLDVINLENQVDALRNQAIYLAITDDLVSQKIVTREYIKKSDEFYKILYHSIKHG